MSEELEEKQRDKTQKDRNEKYQIDHFNSLSAKQQESEFEWSQEIICSLQGLLPLSAGLSILKIRKVWL